MVLINSVLITVNWMLLPDQTKISYLSSMTSLTNCIRECQVFYYLGPFVRVLAELHVSQLTAEKCICDSPRLVRV